MAILPGEGDFGIPQDPASLHGYKIGHLDRSADSLATFKPLDGRGPIGALADICLREGGARILSAGAGTGHQLHDWIQSARVLHLPRSRYWRIYGEAVNDHDFSEMSGQEDVRDAYRTGRLTYTQARIEGYRAPRPFDVVTAYELLVHCPRPQEAVTSLCRTIGSRGILYFNADMEQDAAIEGVLAQLRLKQWDVTKMEAELPLGQELAQSLGKRPRQRRMNYRVASFTTDPFMDSVFAPLSRT